MPVKPYKLLIRAYDVGFGDCFLLTFKYREPTGDRHMLIDFGSTQKPPRAPAKHLKQIAADIRKETSGKLHIVIATHRHKDHIGGFARTKDHSGSGDIIRSLEPHLVIQPWTEDKSKPGNWTGPDASLQLALSNMQAFAEAVKREVRYGRRSATVRAIAEDGLKNLDAMDNLATMGEKSCYVYHGCKIPRLQELLPGVETSILGPPTIKQKANITKQAARNKDEFWQFASFWRMRADWTPLMGAADKLFPLAQTVSAKDRALESKWFVGHLRTIRQEQMLGIVRAMDKALNNTSVILLMKVGEKKFLFPGDAQWENWEYALQKNKEELADVNLYKVGHHGSLNATPKSLWKLFAKKSDDPKAVDRLRSLMSTITDSKHGHEEDNTEVPRRTLVAELRKNSSLYTTQQLEASGKIVDPPLEFELD